MNTCECGCGAEVTGLTRGRPRRFISGHNLRGLEKTATHRARIAEGQRQAWLTKRQRMPVGSTWVDNDGYLREKVAPGAGNWRPQHQLVVERAIGRPLSRREIVHHINGDRQDNRIENLFLCRDRVHHNEVHRSQDVALRAMLAAGLVVFRDGRYEGVLLP